MEEELIKYFSEYITDLRLSKNLSKNKMSKELGIAQSSVVRLEAGQNLPDIITLIKYSEYFNVSIDKLVGIDRN